MKLSPCGHLAIDKENIIGKSETLFTHLFLTEINSRHYGLSLLRTRNRVPDGVRNNGSWLYERSVFLWPHDVLKSSEPFGGITQTSRYWKACSETHFGGLINQMFHYPC